MFRWSAFLEVMAIWLVYAPKACCYLPPPTTYDRAHAQTHAANLQLFAKLDDYRRRIDEYVQARKDMNLPPISISYANKDATNGLEMLQPSGFFRDETPEQARIRAEKKKGPMARFERIVAADCRIPKQPHPLSFIELERHGFSDLISPIVELGGPHEVGRLVGLDWIEPEEEEYEVDESKRPKRVESYGLNIRGSLALGASFEEKMEAAEQLNLGEVKRRTTMKIVKEYDMLGNLKERELPVSTIDEKDGRDGSWYEETDYSKLKVKQKSMQQQKKGEDRFSLNYSQRLYAVVVLAAFVLAHGHASRDIVEHHIWGDIGPVFVDICSLASNVLLAASIASAAVCFRSAASTNRNAAIWGLKGILGGPLTLQEVRSLGPIQNEGENKQREDVQR